MKIKQNQMKTQKIRALIYDFVEMAEKMYSFRLLKIMLWKLNQLKM